MKRKLQPRDKKTGLAITGTDRGSGIAPNYVESDSEDDAQVEKQMLASSYQKLGGWLRCVDCTACLHWQCIGSDRREGILDDLNAENDDGDARITNVGIDKQLDDIPCHECFIDPCICYVCHLDVAGRNWDEAIDVWGQESGDTPADVKADYARPMFRCRRCNRPAHYECLYEEGDKDIHAVAFKLQKEYHWQCLECEGWGEVDEIIAWRRVKNSPYSASKKVAKRKPATTASSSGANPDANKDHAPTADHNEDWREYWTREYLVRFKGSSFRDLTWVPYTWLSKVKSNLAMFHEIGNARYEFALWDKQGIGRALSAEKIEKVNTLDNLVMLGYKSYKYLSADHEAALQDALSGPPVSDPNAEERIPRSWLTPDRVLDIFFHPTILPQTDDAGNPIRAKAVEATRKRKYKQMLRGDNGAPPINVAGLVHIDELEQTDYINPQEAATSFRHLAYALVKWCDLSHDLCEFPFLCYSML